MIANITWGADFAGLVNYLTHNREHDVLRLSGVSSIDDAPQEMANVAALSARAKNKLLHLSMSAAIEDGQLSSAQWLQAVEYLEAMFKLDGHQSVAVRHSDKAHDHIHVFWCTIDSSTGRTPPKQWFMRRGAGAHRLGPHALSADECTVVPVAERAMRTYDFLALARAQSACRTLERKLSLRCLKTPAAAAQARAAGQFRRAPASQRKRAEEIGVTPLMDRAHDIREALEAPDWPSAHRAIRALGLDFEPVYRSTKMGSELRGLVIFDEADPSTRMKASALDTPALKYGLGKLEGRHLPGAAKFSDWWPTRAVAAFPVEPSRTAKGAASDTLKEEFALLRARHIQGEREKAQLRRELRKRQAAEKARLRRDLMTRRKLEAAAIAPGGRRAFYKRYSAEVRVPALAKLESEHRGQAKPLARARAPIWREFIASVSDASEIKKAVAPSVAAQRSVRVLPHAPEAGLPRSRSYDIGESLAALPVPDPMRVAPELTLNEQWFRQSKKGFER